MMTRSCRGGSRTALTRTAPTDPVKRKPLGRLLGAFKTVSSKQINQRRSTPGTIVWQRNYYEHVIRDEADLNRVREYITANPARWDTDAENPRRGGSCKGGFANRPYESGTGGTMIDDIKSYRAGERLKDGQAVIIRAIRADDKEKIARAFRNLEKESIYTRLFTHKTELTESDLKKFTEIDFEKEVGLVVTREIDTEEIIIGSGRYFAFEGAGGKRHAEVAFTVEEDYQGQGMARMILRHLTAIARSRGIVGFDAEVLPGNKAMLAAFARSGLPMKQHFTGDVVHVTLSLSERFV